MNKAMLVVLFAGLLAASLGMGCSNPCQPVFKDYHVFKTAPAGDDDAKETLGKFVKENCDGLRQEWVWYKPQEGNVACRSYKQSKAVNWVIGKGIGSAVESVIKDVSGVDVEEDQDNYSRMKVSTSEECGIKRKATKFKTNPEVCEEGADRDGDWKPWSYVRRVYRMSWRNSIWIDAGDVAAIDGKQSAIAEALPGLKIDFTSERDGLRLMVLDWPDAWAAYRAEEVTPGRCQHYARF